MNHSEMATATFSGKAMDTAESAGTSQLLFPQLYAASRVISILEADRVARQLDIREKDLEKIKYDLKQPSLVSDAEDKMLRFLEAWKDIYPEKCTLNNLTAALRKLDLNTTAAQVTEAVLTGLKDKIAELNNDANCKNELPITEKMITAVSLIVRASVYKSLGFQLGLRRQHIVDVEAECKDEKPSEYVNKTLLKWKENDVMVPTLGKLYSALRMLDCNGPANQVFEKCTKIDDLEELAKLR